MRKVLITGCSSGIGLDSCFYLKEKGWQVLATARREEDVNFLRQEGFNAYQLDITDSNSIQKAIKTILFDTKGELDVLVNNAGFAMRGTVEDLTVNDLRAQFEVNFFGVHELTRQVLPIFKKQKYGRIVNISSIVAMLPFPSLGAYSASKSALESISDVLHNELYEFNVTVSVIQPGPIMTKFQKNTEATLDRFAKRKAVFNRKLYNSIKDNFNARTQFSQVSKFALSPRAVSKKIEKAISMSKPKRRYRITLIAEIIFYFVRLCPQSIIDKLSKRYYKEVRKKC